MENKFNLVSKFQPAGDQPKAINQILTGLHNKEKSQLILGITGSGKTFTMANVIAKSNRPALIMTHNKTLAAQIYAELKEIFPNNAIEYFVSYYDYYQPEVYLAKTDTYIEKDASINEQIDRMRHSATRALLERRDVIVVSSVSCIYGLGSPDLYYQSTISLEKGKKYTRDKLLADLVALQYKRNDIAFERGTFRVKGDLVEIFPSHYAEKAWRLSFFVNELEYIDEFDPITGKILAKLNKAVIFANSHYVFSKKIINSAREEITNELIKQLELLNAQGKVVEAQRLKQRTEYDLEMLLETGTCKGIENYSRFFNHTPVGQPPPTLFQYLPKDGLLFVDESHVMIPQIRAMYNGDRARKISLVEHGFRLPSALDNRPLKFEEWQNFRPQTIFVSATPGEFELNETNGVFVEQIVRPTGLLDPVCIIRPATNQVDDLIAELNSAIKDNLRILVTTLTKKMAEDLTNYLQELNFKVEYLHSEIITLERVEIIKNLRDGKIDIIVGINLLREGLDIPECGLVAILDADKEGFLRSKVSLIQTIGRAARNSKGRVILYADKMTVSIEQAVEETNKRRAVQIAYNKEHNIIPKTIDKKIQALFDLERIEKLSKDSKDTDYKKLLTNPKKLKQTLDIMRKEMLTAASNLEFEKASDLRDKIKLLEEASLDLE